MNRHRRSLSFLLLLFVLPLSAAPPADEDRRLAASVAAICAADYRGDRAELARQAALLDAAPSKTHQIYREYWTGFAFWRRAINGFNETPTPSDLVADLDRCAEHERKALALDPELEDARSALAGCLSGEMFLASQLTPEKKAEVFREGLAQMKLLEQKADVNPRSLWIVGGKQMFAPPPFGGDAVRASATYRRGLEAARREALSAAGRPPWIPS
ncbi:MAG: hypothetical protein ABIT01_14640, partial [Thermoanaerobaculia bacterium]